MTRRNLWKLFPSFGSSRSSLYSLFTLPSSLFHKKILPGTGEDFFMKTYCAFFARSQRAVKAAGSWMAVSESILRFISIPAFFRPYMNLE